MQTPSLPARWVRFLYFKERALHERRRISCGDHSPPQVLVALRKTRDWRAARPDRLLISSKLVFKRPANENAGVMCLPLRDRLLTFSIIHAILSQTLSHAFRIETERNMGAEWSSRTNERTNEYGDRGNGVVRAPSVLFRVPLKLLRELSREDS